LRKIFLLISIILAAQFSFADSYRVLFLGNSHTFFSDVPGLTQGLAIANGDTLFYLQNTPGGCTLGHPSNGHLYNDQSLALIDSLPWDYVILQEHSLFGVIHYYRDNYMYPGAIALDSLIKLNNECTETVVQIIWGKKAGGQYCINNHCSLDFDDFAPMQDTLTAEYSRLGDTLSCILSPAGPAWKKSILTGDPIELFHADSSHANLAGAYFAACVHYSVLFQKPTYGLSFTGGLNNEDALYLQQIADDVVFGDPGQWNINNQKPEAGFEINQLANTIFCTDLSQNAEYYFWDFGDGSTDTVQNPEHTYTSSGTYIISQEVGDNCYSDVVTDTVVVDITTSISEIDQGSGIEVTPAASKGVFKVVSKHLELDGIAVFGVDGRQVFIEELEGTMEYELNLSKQPPGLFILVILTESGVKSCKVPVK